MKLRSNPFVALALTLAASAILPTTLYAAVFTWDTIPADSAITGGVGDWNTANTNWTNDAGATNVSWPSSSTLNDDAVFGGTGGAVTIDAAGITANDLTFNTVNYILGGGALTLDGTTPTITNGVTATVNSVVSAAAPFTKAGNGTLILGGTNSFGTGTTFNYGTSSGASGAIRLSNNLALGGITLINGTSGVGTAQARIELTNNITVTGTELRGGGRSNATTTGATLVNISGDNTWAGAVRINNTGGGHGIRSDLGTLTISGGVNNMIGGTRTWEIGGAGNVTVSGNVTTGVAISKFGAGTLTMSGTGSNYTGDTRIIAGSLVLAHASGISGSSLDMNTADAGTLGFSGITAATLGGLKGSRNLALTNIAAAAVTLTVGSNNATNTYTGLFSGAGHLYKSGTGTQTLDPGAAASMSIGSLSANGGTLILKSGTINTTGIDPGVNAAYALGVGARGGILSIEGANVIVGNNRTFKPGATTNGTVNVLSGTVTSNGGIVIGHNGTVVMTQSGGDVTTTNLYHQDAGAGTYNLTGGTLVARSIYNNTAGTHQFTLNLNGGILKAATGTTNLITTGNTGTQMTVSLGVGNTSIDTSDSNAAIIRPMGDMSAQAGTFTKVGGNSLTLSAVNTYSGNTVISNGILATGVEGAIPFGEAKGNVILNGGATAAGTLNLAGLNISINGLSGVEGAVLGRVVNNTSDSAAVLSVGNNDASSSFAGILADNSTGTGTLGLTKTGTGTLTLSGANTYTGATSVTAGTLALVGGSQASPITVSSGAALGFTLGSPTTSTSTVDFVGLTAKVAVTGTPVAATLMTATNISGTPVLDPAIPGFELAIEGGGTQLNLKSTSGNPFTNWATTTHGLAGGDAAATSDPDNDGLDNAVEFVVGGQPNPANPNANSSGLAPTVSTDATNLIFTFRRTDLALTQPGIGIIVEYGSDLDGWAPAIDGESGVVITLDEEIEAGVDELQVSIPKALAEGEKIFARLNVMIP